MDAPQLRDILKELARSNPREVASLLQDQHVAAVESPAYCMCNNCVNMQSDKMNVCCGQNPSKCLSKSQTFHDLCLKPHTILVAGILNYADRFHDDPNYQTRFWRCEAYRFFILWQWGKLGRGNRVVIPSCCVFKIRTKFPSPDGVYTGYQSEAEIAPDD
jgi:hypothetical protein